MEQLLKPIHLACSDDELRAKKAISIQSYTGWQMKGVKPNGQKLTKKDIEDNEQNIFNCTEILNHYGCELPTVEPKQEPQLTLF